MPLKAMKKPPTARQLETVAADEQPRKCPWPTPSAGEAIAMLMRRGFRPLLTQPDLAFPDELGDEVIEQLTDLLGHYAFRLFLRGAIQKREGFAPREATRYLRAAQARDYAQSLVSLGLAASRPDGRYCLLGPAKTFGGTLEWYVARELRRRFALDVAMGVKLQVRGVGGDLDIVAAGEGKLIYLELKSSPPRNLSTTEIAAFFDRLRILRPDLALFVVDTALRLSDKVLPMLLDEIELRQGHSPAPLRRIKHEIWRLTPHLYAVNGRRDLMANIGRALAEGLLTLSPHLPYQPSSQMNSPTKLNEDMSRRKFPLLYPYPRR